MENEFLKTIRDFTSIYEKGLKETINKLSNAFKPTISLLDKPFQKIKNIKFNFLNRIEKFNKTEKNIKNIIENLEEEYINNNTTEKEFRKKIKKISRKYPALEKEARIETSASYAVELSENFNDKKYSKKLMKEIKHYLKKNPPQESQYISSVYIGCLRNELIKTKNYNNVLKELKEQIINSPTETCKKMYTEEYKKIEIQQSLYEFKEQRYTKKPTKEEIKNELICLGAANYIKAIGKKESIERMKEMAEQNPEATNEIYKEYIHYIMNGSEKNFRENCETFKNEYVVSDNLFASSIIDSLKRETEGKKLIDKIETYCKKYPSVKEFKDFKLSLQPKQKTKQQKQFHQL